MEFCHSYLFVTFVVMTVDQIVERDDFPTFPRKSGRLLKILVNATT